MPLLMAEFQAIYQWCGQWDRAREYSDRALAARHFHTALGVRALLEAQLGHIGEAQQWVERLIAMLREIRAGPTQEHSQACATIAVVAWLTGDISRLDVAERFGMAILAEPPIAPDFAARAHAGLGLIALLRADRTAATEHYRALLSRSGFLQDQYTGFVADRLLGQLAATTGKPDAAVRHFEQAISFARSAGVRPELAWSCHGCAETLLRRNQPGDARQAESLLAEAISIADELGMKPLQERSIERGERIYPDGLTEREVEVLRLIAQGKTSKQIAEELFIAVKTVNTHIQNLYEKTGSANRADATAYAIRNDLAGS